MWILFYYELVHLIPVSLWKEIKEQIGASEEDTYICMLGRENVTLEELDALQGQVESLIAGDYKIAKKCFAWRHLPLPGVRF